MFLQSTVFKEAALLSIGTGGACISRGCYVGGKWLSMGSMIGLVGLGSRVTLVGYNVQWVA